MLRQRFLGDVAGLVVLLATGCLCFLHPSQAFLPILSCNPTKLTLHGDHGSAIRRLTSTPHQASMIVTRSHSSTSAAAVDGSRTKGASAVRSQRPTPPSDASQFQMVSLYQFRPIPDTVGLRDTVFDAMVETVPGLRGSLYIAEEGINGQFAVPLEGVEAFTSLCQKLLQCEAFNWGDVVPVDTPTFQRLIVRIRDVILRDGLEEDSRGSLNWSQAGDELSPAEWDRELRSTTVSSSASPSPLILDCRNDYESNQGTFQGAIPLNTSTFAESWGTLQAVSDSVANKDDPVYIFCTGGIRCVKVGAFLKQSLGFTNVKRLEHGIIGYQRWQDQQQADAADADEQQSKPSLWKGENFLFDKRRFAGESSESDSDDSGANEGFTDSQ